MSSTDQSENDFLSKYCATESDICESIGIQKPKYTDLDLVILKSKKRSFQFICPCRTHAFPDLTHRMENIRWYTCENCHIEVF